jgi:hypothetical protein
VWALEKLADSGDSRSRGRRHATPATPHLTIFVSVKSEKETSRFERHLHWHVRKYFDAIQSAMATRYSEFGRRAYSALLISWIP